MFELFKLGGTADVRLFGGLFASLRDFGQLGQQRPTEALRSLRQRIG